MKSFAEFYRQVSKHKLLKEENMAGSPVSGFSMTQGTQNNQTGDIDLGMGADPIPLSKFAQNPAIAQSLVKSGNTDNNATDDIIKAEFTGIRPNELKPTQTTLVWDKVLSMIQTGITKPEFLKDMQAIVSGDNAIMDGHHRWAAALVLYPQNEVRVLKMNLPLGKLISVLNAYTVGQLGVMQGNPSKGDTIEQAFAKLREKLGTLKPELLAQIPDANGDPQKGLQILIENLDAIPAASKTSATNLPREEMPVIPPDGMDKDAVLQALQKAANDGMIDIKGPLSIAVQKALSDAGVATYGGHTTGKTQDATRTIKSMGNMQPSGQQNAGNAGSAFDFGNNKMSNMIKTSGPNAGVGNMAGNVTGSNNTMPANLSFNMQNASTFHPGLNINEQLLVLSGVLTIEEAENNLKNRKRR